MNSKTIGDRDGASAAMSRYTSPASFWWPEYIELSAWFEHAPFAFWLVDAYRPRTIAELGTHNGYSYFAFCQAVKTLGLDAHCYAIDTWKGDEHAGYYGEEVYQRVSSYNDEHYAAFSRLVRSTFDKALSEFSDTSLDLLHIDGRHFYEDVKHDFESWRPKLSERAIVVFHDINVREREFGVFRLWEELKAKYRAFEFVHGHGLGVLAYGTALPKNLLPFFDMTPDMTVGVRVAYARLGAAIKDAFRQREAEGAQRQAQVLQRTVQQENEALRQALDQGRAELDAARRQNNETLQRIIKITEDVQKTTSARAEELSQRNGQLTARITTQAQLLNASNDRVRRLQTELQDLHRSTSWRLTKPIRAIKLGPKLLWRRLSDHRLADCSWRAQNEDSSVILTYAKGKYPAGWVKLDIAIEYEKTPVQEPRLCLDFGNEFYKAESLVLPMPKKGVISTAVYLTDDIKTLRFDPMEQNGSCVLFRIRMGKASKLAAVFRRANASAAPRPVGPGNKEIGLAAAFRQIWRQDAKESPYQRWVAKYSVLTDDERRKIRSHMRTFEQHPLVSVIVPVYNTPERILRECIESVRAQLYDNWELCIADDASTAEHVQRLLRKYQRLDDRIKVAWRSANGHISAASNSALALASGEFIALLDHDDLLSEDALYRVAAEVNHHPDVDIIYSDEDVVNEQGYPQAPHFKSDWNPDLFYSQNYLCHLGVYRKSLVDSVGGFREGFEGSQDYDLCVRCVDMTLGERIRHIPRVLYHWRAMAGSTALLSDAKPYAADAAVRALQEKFSKIDPHITIEQNEYLPTTYRVRYPVPAPAPLVSVIIPTKDNYNLLRKCVESVVEKTNYSNYEVIIVDNNTSCADALEYLDRLDREPRFRVLRYAKPFNYSAINNYAVSEANGELLCLLNNDVEVITPDWLGEMVSHALRPEIGIVGAKLLYSDGRIQHAGVILGLGGVAAHSHRYFPREDPGYFGRLVLTQNVSANTAACIVLRKELYEKVEGLEEALVVAFNDVDLSIKVREAGFRNIWTPYAVLYHHESATRGYEDTPEKKARFATECEYLRKNWAVQLACDPYYSPNLTDAREDFSLAWPPRVNS